MTLNLPSGSEIDFQKLKYETSSLFHPSPRFEPFFEIFFVNFFSSFFTFNPICQSIDSR
eukprot:UN27260